MTRTQRPADRFITEMHLVDVQQAQGPILLWEDTMQLELITSWVTIFRKKKSNAANLPDSSWNSG